MPVTLVRALDSSPLRTAAVLLALLLVVAALPAGQQVGVTIDPHGLEDLGAGWSYEGWLIVDGVPVSTGTFTVDSNGAPSSRYFAAMVSDATAVAAFVLTIEPVPDADPGPSHVHLLGASLAGGHGVATVGHPAALGDDFTSAAGSFILAAPSAGDGGDYHNGIWWLDPTGPSATLDLPTLPDGWVYEGWIAGGEGPMSTGRFSSVSGADSDGGGLTSGPHGTPPFPGQDFVVPPRDLTGGYAAVISIEPDPDNSPAPFTLKPLVKSSIDDVGMGVLQAMGLNLGSFPTADIMVTAASVAPEMANLRLHLEGLDDLGAGWAYEGWLIVDGAPVSTGTFTVSNGVPSATFFSAPVSDLDAVAAFVLTIEPVPDSDPSPSSVHLLGGDFVHGAARLAIDHGAAIGTDFATATGSYILAAPSAGAGGDYRNGIWWLDPTGPSATLDLPALPEGWVYEGWVASADGPVSTGRFSSVTGADSDGGGPDKGPEATPPFPGQDFVDPARDLTMGYAAVVSVEPEPDNSPAPFTLKPLLDPIIDDLGMGVLQPMHLNTASIPSGRVEMLEAHVISAGGHTQGAYGSSWWTQLELASLGQNPVMARVELLRGGQPNPAPEGVDVMVPASGAVRVADAFDTLFDASGTGALRVLAPAGALATTSRTANDTGSGSLGQGIPAVMADQATRYGSSARLLGLSSSADSGTGSRTNVGFVNPCPIPVTVALELHRADGSLIGTRTFTFGALEQAQLNNVFASFGEADVELGYAVAYTTTPGGKIIVYASVIDNASGDPTWVAAQ